MEKLDIIGVAGLSAGLVVTLRSPLMFYTVEGVSLEDLVVALCMYVERKHSDTKVDVQDFIKQLYYSCTPEVLEEAMEQDYFCISVPNQYLGYYDEADYDKPSFINGGSSDVAWVLTLPPHVTAEYLAKQIKKHFIGIGGMVNMFNEPNDYSHSVVFMSSGSNINEDDVCCRHLVSYEINHDELEWYFYQPKTVGENIEQLRDSGSYDCLKMFMKKVERRSLKMSDPMPVNERSDDRVVDDIIRFVCDTSFTEADRQRLITDLSYLLNEVKTSKLGPEYLKSMCSSFEYVLGVPLKVQVEACAIVAGLSYDEMYSRIAAHSDNSMLP
jgi:hypothetical protein